MFRSDVGQQRSRDREHPAGGRNGLRAAVLVWGLALLVDVTFSSSGPGGQTAVAAPGTTDSGASQLSAAGYWLVAPDGGVFSFGDAPFYGSAGNVALERPVVGVAATPSGHGYWLVASDGGVFSFGDAAFYGSAGNVALKQPIAGISPYPHLHTLLVVGDSLVTQSEADLTQLRPPATFVWIAAGVGSAPCDWAHGYRDPYSHNRFRSLAGELQQYHPQAVAIAFSGNPGLSGPSNGCVDRTDAYTLDQLLASYGQSITEMAMQASAAGAAVYLDAAPARNPATPPGLYQGPGGQPAYDFTGVPQINQLLLTLTTGSSGEIRPWHYDPTAGELLGGQPLSPNTTEMVWQQYLPCSVSPHDPCTNGLTQVRVGGNSDAIHLYYGAGTKLFAEGVDHEPLHTVIHP